MKLRDRTIECFTISPIPLQIQLHPSTPEVLVGIFPLLYCLCYTASREVNPAYGLLIHFQFFAEPKIEIGLWILRKTPSTIRFNQLNNYSA